MSSVTKALRCQAAEHAFAGMPCGIMDQYISAMGEDSNFLLIDCRSNECELVSFGAVDSSSQFRLVVTNSNVKHKLSSSEYPVRVAQCKESVAAIKAIYPHINSLRDVNMEMLEGAATSMSGVVYRRARHCVTENDRTLNSVKALRSGDFSTVGVCMTQSHQSLRDDYEVIEFHAEQNCDE